MNDQERADIEKIPPQYKPLSAWSYFGYTILFAIPIVGTIFIIVFSLNSSNINRRSFARSYICVWIIVAIVFIIMLVAGGGIIGSLMSGMQGQ